MLVNWVLLHKVVKSFGVNMPRLLITLKMMAVSMQYYWFDTNILIFNTLIKSLPIKYIQ